VVLCCRKNRIGGEFLEGAVVDVDVLGQTLNCDPSKNAAASIRTCLNLPITNLLMKQPFTVACNYTPRSLLLCILMLHILKVHKNKRFLYPFCTYTQKKPHKCTPADHNMVKIA